MPCIAWRRAIYMSFLVVLCLSDVTFLFFLNNDNGKGEREKRSEDNCVKGKRQQVGLTLWSIKALLILSFVVGHWSK
jgi:hypothetical protein